MHYELWDQGRARRLGVFDTEHQALAWVRGVVVACGPGAAEVHALGLLRMEWRWQGAIVLEGPALAERALALEDRPPVGEVPAPSATL